MKRSAPLKHSTFSWSRVGIGADNNCWPWLGSINRWGYGDCVWNGRRSNASRAAYEASNGPLPAGLVVCHQCDNPACCNPSHLWAGTQAENLADCRAKGRQVYRTGAAHHRPTAKMTEDMVKDARRMYADGVSQTEIARRWGLHSSSISRAVRGKKWAHVK
jgi:hypothetical protein